MTCEACLSPAMKIYIVGSQLLCPDCRDLKRGDVHNHAAAVIGDDIPGGFVQEHFGHTPEVFYSKKAMLKRADALGLKPFVRHVDGDKNTSRWV